MKILAIYASNFFGVITIIVAAGTNHIDIVTVENQ